MKKLNIFSDKIDMVLLVCSILAALTGIFVVNSASNTMDAHLKYVIVQSVALILGIGAMSGVIFFSYKYFEKLRKVKKFVLQWHGFFNLFYKIFVNVHIFTI